MAQNLRQYRWLKQQVIADLSHAKDTGSESDVSTPPTEEKRQASLTLLKGEELARTLNGVTVRERTPEEGGSGLVFVVGWGEKDPQNPFNWSTPRRFGLTVLVSLIAVSVTATSTIDAVVAPQAAEYYGVSETASSLITGMYLIGFAVGSLFAGSLSELMGRNVVYMVGMVVYMIFIMATALAPNFGGALVFRWLAGFFGSAPLTVAGGTIADIWQPLEAAWSFPVLALLAFGGPLLGPVIGSYIGGNIDFHWADWLMLIMAALILSLVVLLQRETFGPVLLSWKAKHLRTIVGDDRYLAESEITFNSKGFIKKLLVNLYRPFVFVVTEPIVLSFAVYLTTVYIILFTFFSGFPVIFEQTYGISQGETNLIWLAVLIGVFSTSPVIYLVYGWTAKELEAATAEGRLWRPEIRLWYAMLGGSVSLPISLFWVGWTCYPSISIWVPIVGTIFFGYGLMAIFMSAYMYIIDSYLMYAASALSFNAFARYTVAGGMTVVGVPMYNNLGRHWTCTLLGCLSLILVPVPFVLYKFGPAIRQRSKNVVNRQK